MDLDKISEPHLSKPEKGHFAKELAKKGVQRTTVDFTTHQLRDLDDLASQLNISRQVVIKMICDDYITRRKLANV